jgi:ribosomal protein L29
MKNTENIKKYRAMNGKDLNDERKKVMKEQLLVSLKVSAGKEDNFSQIKKLRKNIACLNTIIAEKEYGVRNE